MEKKTYENLNFSVEYIRIYAHTHPVSIEASSSQDADTNFGDMGSATFSAKCEFCIIKVLKERWENNEKICLGLIFF